MFDQEAIRETNRMAKKFREIWDRPEVYNEYSRVQMEVRDTVLCGQESGSSTKGPTKHIKKTNPQLIDRKLYLSQKKTLPNITPPDLNLGRNLVDIQDMDRLQSLRRRMVADFCLY